jgi:hypothetical protein
MKNKLKITVYLLMFVGFMANAQTKINTGIGYFGEVVTYPGIVGEIELEKFHSPGFSTPLKLNVGFYNHPRSHNAMFIDIHEGFRRYSKSGAWYFEQSVGFGIMLSFYNEDVWHFDEEGNSAYVSNIANLDYMPSVTFGGGYNFTPQKESANVLWVRPKIFWQLPYNNLALPHIAVQVGFSHTIKTR